MLIPDGIWLDLPHHLHIADPALGSDDLKGLLLNPVYWHASQRNPVWRRLLASMNGETSPKAAFRRELAKRYGECVHTMALEPDKFDERYFVPPPDPEYPETKEEMAAALRELRIDPPRMSLTKDHFEAACRLHSIPIARDWETELALLCSGRMIILDSWREPLALTERVIDRHPAARKFLSRGRPEVSVFYTDEHGDRYRARFDYLRVRTLADVKTFDNKKGGDPIAVFCSARDQWAYDVQAVNYMDVRTNVLPQLIGARRIWRGAPVLTEDGHIEALPPTADDLRFLDEVAAFTDPSWWWITISTNGVPEVDTIEFPKDLIAFHAARTQVELAKQNYRDMRAKFGPDDGEMWIADRGMLRLTDQNFSRRSLDRGAVLHDTIPAT